MGRKTRQTSPATTQPADVIAALEATTSKANKAIDELREVTQEAHAAVQAAKEARAAMVRRVAKEFDDRAAEVMDGRAERLFSKVKEDMNWNLSQVKQGIESWNEGMAKTSDYSDRCVDAMRDWLAAFAKLADELEREIIASNPQDSYVQGVPARVFGKARESYRALLAFPPERSKLGLPITTTDLRAERAESSSGA